MRYKLTKVSELRLSNLVRLIRETRPFLATVTPSIRSEWDRIRGRFPSEDDARQGYTSLSDFELEDLRSKVQRFRPEAPAQPSAPDAQLVQVSSADWQPQQSMTG